MARTKNFDRQAVLERAMELFWRKGFHATSIADLVKYLGISRASIYDTYNSKNELYLEALHHYRSIGQGKLIDLPPYEQDIKAWLRMFMYGLIEESKSDAHRKGCFIVNAVVDIVPEDKSVYETTCNFAEENQEFFIRRFEPVFLRAMEQGELDPSHDPRGLALFLFNTVNGLRILARTTQDLDELKTVADTAIRVFY